MDSGVTGKSASRARGRIAEVLADARASLKEPSRPFTPASLDHRTSLSSFSTLDKHARIALVKTPGYGKILKKEEGSRSRGYKELDVPSKPDAVGTVENDGIKNVRSRGIVPDTSTVPGRRQTSSNSTSKTSTVSSSKNISNDVLTSVKYLRSLLLSGNINTDALLLFNVQSVKEVAEKSYQSVEKISKFLKSDETNNLLVINDVQNVIEEFFHFLSEENDIEIESEFTQKLICRLVLLLSVSVLSRNVYLNTVALSSSSLRLTKIANIFLKTIKIVFNNLKLQSSRKNSSSIITNLMPNSENMKILRQQERELLLEKNTKDNDLYSFGDLSDFLGDFIFQNCIDLLLEFQTLFSILMPNLGLQIIHMKSKIVIDMNVDNDNNNNNNDNNDDNNDNFKNLEDKSEGTFLFEDKIICDKEIELFELLEIAIFSSAILRHHSNDENNRKKINHLKMMENNSELLRSLGSFTVSCQKEILFNKEKYRKNLIFNKNEYDDTDSLLNKMIEKMSEIVVQLVVVIRNFSIDVKGRYQIQNTNIIGILCSLLKPYKKFPELCLNCVRVTAKLSLQDNFRAQINNKSSYIKCLIETLIWEGQYCNNIINGNNILNEIKGNEVKEKFSYSNSNCVTNDNIQNKNSSHDNKYQQKSDEHKRTDNECKIDKEYENKIKEEIDTWPFWYTWPLISRVAFTLGNLTTSNNNNRVIIGLDSKSLDPILSLLKVCSSTLSQLYDKQKAQQKQESKAKESEYKEMREIDDSEDDDEDEENPMIGQELSDATIKLLRLLANLSIEENIGMALAEKTETLQILIELATCSNNISTGDTCEARTGEEEELLLNTVAACTNITFYACKGRTHDSLNESLSYSKSITPKEGKLQKQLVALSIQLTNCLFHENEEVVLESARALGNLTRNRECTQSMILLRSDEALLLLLAHNNPEIVSAVCGALVNLSGDPGWRFSYRTMKEYKKTSPFTHLLGALRKSAMKDLVLSTLICQVIHNLLLPDNIENNVNISKSVKDGLIAISVKTDFIDTIPPLLISTLTELIECSDDMSDTISSLFLGEHSSIIKEKEIGKEKGNDIKPMGHIFKIPELMNTDKNMKKYVDFSFIGRSVLSIISPLDNSSSKTMIY